MCLLALRAAVVSWIAMAGAASAQSLRPLLVLTQMPPPVRSALFEVDPVTGVPTPLGSFPSEHMLPLAVAVDPFDGDVVVALQDAAAAANVQIVRLRRSGPGALSEQSILQPGVAVYQLGFLGEDLVFAFNGGVVRMPRRGGTPSLAYSRPNTTAIDPDLPGDLIAVAWTGTPATAFPDSGTCTLDAGTGAFVSAPASFANATGRTTTGIVELATAVPRHLLAFTDGSFAQFAPAIAPTPQPLLTSMPIPVGGAVAVKAAAPMTLRPMALGGAAFPYLYELDAFTGVVVLRSSALPGDPVDFAVGIDRSAHLMCFGTQCGAWPPQRLPAGMPTLGSNLMLFADAEPGAVCLLALGLDDWAGGLLPTALPFAAGCSLQIAPDALVATFAGPTGLAGHTLPLPTAPMWIGVPLFAQWGQFDSAGFSLGVACAWFLGL